MLTQKRFWFAILLFVAALVVLPSLFMLWQFKSHFAIVEAAASGDAAKVEVLLQRGADLNAEHLEGSSALWWAVENGSLETVQVLLSHGANPNSRGQYTSVIESALAHLADAEGTAKEPEARAIVRALLASGAKTGSIQDKESLGLLKKMGKK